MIPKRCSAFLVILLACFAMVPDVGAQDEGPAELRKLNKSYEKHKSENLAPLVEKYVEALKRLQKKLTGDGELEKALAVRDYQVIISLDKEKRASTHPTEPKELADLAKVFHKARDAKVDPLQKTYVGALERLEKKLADDGRLKDAIAVKKVRVANAEEEVPKKPIRKSAGGQQESSKLRDFREESVLWWNFEGGGKRTVKDGSKARNDGKLEGAKIIEDKDRGKVASFVQPTDMIRLDPAKKFAIDTLTISMWLKSRDGKPDTGLFSFATEGSSNELQIAYYNGLHFRHRKVLNTSKQPPKLGVWLHVAVTFDRKSGESVIYVDGEKLGTAKFPPSRGADGGILIIAQDQDMYGGALDPKQAFSGEVDDIVVMPRVLSRTEVASLYREQKRKG